MAALSPWTSSEGRSTDPMRFSTAKQNPGAKDCGGSQIKDFLRIVPGAANAPGWEGEHCQTKN
nr:MAG TPA: hypothetical protein [Caudoviricetes sp.]